MVLWAQPTKPGSHNTQKKKRGHRAPPMVTHGSPGISSPCRPHLPSAGFPGEHLSLSTALVITEGRVEQNWSGQGSLKCASHWQSPEVRMQNCKQEFLTSTCDSHSCWGALTGQRPQQTVTCLRRRIPSQQLHGKHEPMMDILKWKHQTLTLESESLCLETRLGHTGSSMVVDEGPHHERARLICQGCEVWLNNYFFPGETHTAFNFFLCY